MQDSNKGGDWEWTWFCFVDVELENERLRVFSLGLVLLAGSTASILFVAAGAGSRKKLLGALVLVLVWDLWPVFVAFFSSGQAWKRGSFASVFG
jgi:hypothetical protein